MDRREAIKSIAIGAGYVVSVPVLLQLTASCKTESAASVATSFFNDGEMSLVSKLVDTLLPATDTPGALEAGVPKIMDQLVAQIMTKDDQKNTRDGLQAVLASIEESSGKSLDDIDNAGIGNWMDSLKDMDADKNQAIMQTMNGLRDTAIAAYFGSELIGKNHLVYDPVPGEFIGCVDINDATGGIQYSL